MDKDKKKIALFCGIPLFARVDDRTFIRPIFHRVGLLAKSLIDQGFDVKVFAPSYNYYSQNPINKIEGIEVISIGLANLPFSPFEEKKPSIIKYLREIKKSLKTTKNEIEKFAPDRIHFFTTFFYSIATGLFLKLKGYKVYIDVDDAINGQMICNNYSFILVALQKIIDYILPRFFNGVTVCSKFLKSRIGERSVIIPNMVSSDFYIFDQREKNKDSETIKVVMVGSIDGIQGHEKVVSEVIPKVCEDCSNIKFIFVGEGKALARVKELASSWIEQGQVKFMGYQGHSQIPVILSECDIGLLPLGRAIVNLARCPLKMLEYKAAGVVVVASCLGEAERLNKHLKTALLAPCDDYQEFSKLIVKLAKNKSLRKEIAENAYKDSLNFGIEKVVLQWLEFWELN